MEYCEQCENYIIEIRSLEYEIRQLQREIDYLEGRERY